jgi:hypothetical protein
LNSIRFEFLFQTNSTAAARHCAGPPSVSPSPSTVRTGRTAWPCHTTHARRPRAAAGRAGHPPTLPLSLGPRLLRGTTPSPVPHIRVPVENGHAAVPHAPLPLSSSPLCLLPQYGAPKSPFSSECGRVTAALPPAPTVIAATMHSLIPLSISAKGLPSLRSLRIAGARQRCLGPPGDLHRVGTPPVAAVLAATIDAAAR